MNKLLYLAIAWVCVGLVLCSEAKAQTYSREGGKEHVIVSVALGLGCANVFQDSWGKAFGCAMTPGLVKELIDSRQEGNKFSGSDLAFDALGAVLGVTGGRWLIRRQEGTTTVSYRMEF